MGIGDYCITAVFRACRRILIGSLSYQFALLLLGTKNVSQDRH